MDLKTKSAKNYENLANLALPRSKMMIQDPHRWQFIYYNVIELLKNMPEQEKLKKAVKC